MSTPADSVNGVKRSRDLAKQHVLPKGFVKIRHYGLLAGRHREERLTLARRLLLVEAVCPADGADGTVEPAAERCCPECGSVRLIYLEILDEPRARMDCVPASPADTS